MCVIHKIRCNEGPLRESRSIDVRRKVVEVSDARGARGDVGDSVMYDERGVFSNEIGVRV